MSDCTPDTHDWRYDSGRSLNDGAAFSETAANAGPFRVCGRCLIGHQLADIPANHPESMTEELGDDIEEMLAEVDLALFPEEIH